MGDYETRKEIQLQTREHQTKFVYYILALNVAAIGFTVHQTFNQKLEFYYILLGGSLLFWTSCIICGFQFLQVLIKGLISNSDYFSFIKDYSHLDDIAKEILIEKVDKYNKKSKWYFKYQQVFFYLGVALFLIWHISRMTYN